MKQRINTAVNTAGLFTLSLRWVIGWTYFSAFWRRLVLADKLIPEEAGYIGEKFNHFLPNAIGIKPIIEYLVTHPEALQTSMVAFTIIEAIVGLFIILGLFTRLMSIGVFSLAMGILLGSGWIGTTCLDEWQIGILGLAGGFTIFLTGSSHYSLDQWLINRSHPIAHKKWFSWLASGDLPMNTLKPWILGGSMMIFGLALYTNQVFHGGVFGTLHNKSVKPKIELSDVRFEGNQLVFQIYRVEGADVYGSFLIGIELLDKNGVVLFNLNQEKLAQYPSNKIKNRYVAKIKPGKHSLIIPLGAKADFMIDLDNVQPIDIAEIKLTDISGIVWKAQVH